MATDASTVPESLDGVRQPPAGVVKPPRDIQAIVEKTAGYVARNGAVFEDRIREKEKVNPKFSFLNTNDAYAPFYAWRLQEIKSGRGTAVSAGRTAEDVAAQVPEKPAGPPQPADFQFSARMPIISAQDLDVIRMTALFVACNGKSFMTNLVQREGRNFQFDFLRPQHSLHQFFSRLVDQYSLLLRSSSQEAEKAKSARLSLLQKQITDKASIMERASQRAEWVKYLNDQKQKKEEAAEKEQIEYAQIDWHDFVVVETVLFDDGDEQATLPPPTSQNDLQSASLEQKAAMSLQSADRRIEEAMPTAQDESLFHNGNHYPTVANPFPQPPPMHSMPPPFPPQQPIQPIPSPAIQNYQTHNFMSNDTEEQAIYERTQAREQAQAVQNAARNTAGQPIRIREDYVPRAQAKRQTVASAICPNCKQSIPVNELEQHMKIELLDPRWKEQRMKAESRASTTNLSTSDVAANLKRLTSQRSDLFDGQSDQARAQNEEEERRKRMALGQDSYPVPPPNFNNVPPQGMKGGSIEEQIRLIHQKAKS